MAPEEDLKALVDGIAGTFTGEKSEGKEAPPPSKAEEGEGSKGGEAAPPPDTALILDLTKKPEEIVGDLLKHPTIGRQLQSWAGKGAASAVKSALEQHNIDAEAQAQRQQLREWDEHFRSLSEGELAEELARSRDAALAYAEVQKWRSQAGDEVRAAVAQVYAVHVQSILDTLNNSGLPDAIKETLKPDNWTHLGAKGIYEWGKAVDEAVVEFKAEQLATTKLEAMKQQEAAERERDGAPPPDMTPGRRAAGGKLDLMSTPSPLLLEAALAEKKPDKQ